MNVLIDANVALDVILERQPWLDDSKGVWDACHQKRITGHLVGTGLTASSPVPVLTPTQLLARLAKTQDA
jgi:hypothetical protein